MIARKLRSRGESAHDIFCFGNECKRTKFVADKEQAAHDILHKELRVERRKKSTLSRGREMKQAQTRPTEVA